MTGLTFAMISALMLLGTAQASLRVRGGGAVQEERQDPFLRPVQPGATANWQVTFNDQDNVWQLPDMPARAQGIIVPNGFYNTTAQELVQSLTPKLELAALEPNVHVEAYECPPPCTAGTGSESGISVVDSIYRAQTSAQAVKSEMAGLAEALGRQTSTDGFDAPACTSCTEAEVVAPISALDYSSAEARLAEEEAARQAELAKQAEAEAAVLAARVRAMDAAVEVLGREAELQQLHYPHLMEPCVGCTEGE